jgi:hypothetical protein
LRVFQSLSSCRKGIARRDLPHLVGQFDSLSDLRVREAGLSGCRNMNLDTGDAIAAKGGSYGHQFPFAERKLIHVISFRLNEVGLACPPA